MLVAWTIAPAIDPAAPPSPRWERTGQPARRQQASFFLFFPPPLLLLLLFSSFSPLPPLPPHPSPAFLIPSAFSFSAVGFVSLHLAFCHTDNKHRWSPRRSCRANFSQPRRRLCAPSSTTPNNSSHHRTLLPLGRAVFNRVVPPANPTTPASSTL